jgi:diguanylate cyclase
MYSKGWPDVSVGLHLKRNAHDVVLQVTVSAGAASHRAGESAQDWVARTDHALYHSKQTGRNRVTLAELT